MIKFYLLMHSKSVESVVLKTFLYIFQYNSIKYTDKEVDRYWSKSVYVQ